MGLILSVVNQKGGVGKTTTSVNVSAYLAKMGKKTLLIDADPQGNATSGIGMEKNDLERTIYDVVINGEDINDVIVSANRKNLFICPANIDLAGAEIEMVNLFSRETVLKKAFQKIKDDYDFVIIDCPPSLGLLTVNALTASDGVVVPIQAEYYALEGLSQLLNTINKVKKHLNPSLEIFGVVVTMFDSRTQLANQVASEVRQYFGEKLFKSIIPRNVRLSEAPSHGLSISEYDKRSKGSDAYEYLSKEIIKRSRKF
ncbi:MAG: AAA family ATPase [Eubacteriales bacterium]|nr:AAA family ATPase [Eubacteriales bacterium]MDD4327921.1 AAA family ATPase [Eubacteriales bacterium]